MELPLDCFFWEGRGEFRTEGLVDFNYLGFRGLKVSRGGGGG